MESTDSSSASQVLPPGFRFHPTDEELVVHYLKKKAASAPLPVAIIAEVDLYKFDPWELPAKAIFGEQEWYFFSPRDRKYPNGARPNRAATSGYWKATGTDKPVVTAAGTHKVGVKKALVFYGVKPPKGIKTNWIMHEYRLVDSTKPDFPNKKPTSLRLDDWVLCRIYKKNARPRDDHIHSALIPQSMPSSIMSINGQHKKFLEKNDAGNMMVMMNSKPVPQLDNLLIPAKRNYLYDQAAGNASSPSTKRFLQAENILSQLPPQTPPSLQQMGNLGDEVFAHETYQLSGLNWYTS